MNTTKLSVAGLFSTLLLAACGGGGSSNGVTGQTNSSTGGTPSTNTAPKLSISVRSENQCGIHSPQTDAVLIVHNDDFTNRSVHHADANGAFSVELGSERANISVLSKTKYLDEQEFTEIDTYYQVTATDLGRINNFYESRDDASCDCRLTDISVINSNENEQPERVSLGYRDFVGANYTIDGAFVSDWEVCRQSNSAQLPVLLATLLYGPDDAPRVYTGKIDNYTHGGTAVIEANSLQNEMLFSANTTNRDEFYVSSRGVGADGTLYSALRRDASLPVTTYFSGEDVDYTNLALYRFDNATEYISMPNHRLFTFALRSFENQPGGMTDIGFFDNTLFAAEVEHTINNDEYDFSSVGEADVFWLTTDIRDSNNRNILRWRILTPVSGNLGNIDNFSIEGVDFTSNNKNEPQNARVDWRIWNFAEANSFDGYLSMWAELNSTDEIEPRNYEYISIRVDIDDPNMVLPTMAATAKKLN